VLGDGALLPRALQRCVSHVVKIFNVRETYHITPNFRFVDTVSHRAAKMFQALWMWRQEYQHHEQLPLAFNGTWPSWNSDLDNRPW
jgi:hypothetical protein